MRSYKRVDSGRCSMHPHMSLRNSYHPAVKNISDNHIDHSALARVDQSTKNRLIRYELKPGDIVFGRKGAVDRRALISEKEKGWLQGSDCIRLRFFCDSIDPKFVSYAFGTEEHKNWINQHAHGATMPSLNQDIIGKIPIILPPLPTQRAIAHILGTLDVNI